MQAAKPYDANPPISYDGSPQTRAFWGGNLPHWDVLGRPIFLTLHVRGAIPKEAMQRIRADAASLCNRRDTDYSRRLGCLYPAAPSAWRDGTSA